MLNGDYSLPNTRPETFRALIRALLQVSVSRRPGIDTVVRKLERMASSLPSRALPASQPQATMSSSNGSATQPTPASHTDAPPGKLWFSRMFAAGVCSAFMKPSRQAICGPEDALPRRNAKLQERSCWQQQEISRAVGCQQWLGTRVGCWELGTESYICP